MPSPPFPFPSPTTLLQIQKCIPKSWKSPPPPPSNPQPLISSIRSLGARGRLAASFALYSHLRRRYPAALLHPISSLLACSTTARAIAPGKQLHAHIITLGIHNNPHLISRLTAFYASIHLLSARTIVLASISPHPFPWNLLMSAYNKITAWLDTLIVYRIMVENGVDTDEFSYATILRACGELRDLSLGRELHTRILHAGMWRDLFVGNGLVAMYLKCDQLDVARKMFDGMPERDVVTCNTMIAGYVSKGMWEEAFGVLEMVPEGVEVDVVTWNTIIRGYLRMGNFVEVLRLIRRMRGSGSGVDSVTLVVGLKVCSSIASLRQGREIHGFAVRMEWDGIEHVRNTVITMYLRCGRASCAYVLFRDSASKSLVTWNAVIAGLARADRVDEATGAFKDMVRSGMQTNYVTVVTMLSVCARCTNIRHGRELHCFMTIHGVVCCLLLENTLVNMYSRSGSVSSAQMVFDRMSSHDVTSYTSLILGYGMERKGFTSLKLFNEMIVRGFAPDHVTLVAILSACGNSCKKREDCSDSPFVTQAQIIFENMAGLYGIVPRVEHYSCMVDLYGRVGLLRRAEVMLNRMPIPPSAAMLATLVGACWIHHNPEIGKRSADKLLERLLFTGSKNPSHYCLVAKMYAYSIRTQLGLRSFFESSYQ